MGKVLAMQMMQHTSPFAWFRVILSLCQPKICHLHSSVSVNAQMAVFTSLKNVQNVQILRARRKENSSGELNTSRCLSSDVYTPRTKANEILVRHYVDWSAG